MFKLATVLLFAVCLVSQVQGLVLKGDKKSAHHGDTTSFRRTNHFHRGKMFKRATSDMHPHEGILMRQLPSGEMYPIGEAMRQFERSQEMSPMNEEILRQISSETRPMSEGILRQISDINYENQPMSEGILRQISSETRRPMGEGNFRHLSSDEIRPREFPQGRTIGPIVDQLSQGIANGLSVGLSTGISSGITNGVYALPDAISGTVHNLKQGQLGGGGGGGIYAGGAPYGGSYLSPIKGGSFSFGAPSVPLSSGFGLSHGTSYTKPYSGYGTMSPVFSSGYSGIHPGSANLYSMQGQGNFYTGGMTPYSMQGQGNFYTGGMTPYSFNKKPIISSLKPAILGPKPIGGPQHVAPAAPYHWDCKLIPVLNKLGYKDAGNDMEDQVENLSQLIQEAGMMNDGPMRSLGVPRSSGDAQTVIDEQPIRIAGLPKSAQMQETDMGTYRDNLLQEMEIRKNLALLEEMNMSLPPLGMIDPNKLVDNGDIMEHLTQSKQQHQEVETPIMVMLIPMTDDHNQGTVGQQMSGVSQMNQEMIQGNKQGVLNTQAGNAKNQQKQQLSQQQQQQQQQQLSQQQPQQHQQLIMQPKQQQNQKQQHHGQTNIQSDEHIGAHSTNVDIKVKPELDVKKPATSGKGKIVHDELRQSDQENLLKIRRTMKKIEYR
ncbi:hypothetical protein WDU94_006772 [Cyamophila willieti]